MSSNNRSGYSSRLSTSSINLPQNGHDLVKMLCQTSENALKRIEDSRYHSSRFHRKLQQMPKEQNRRLEVLKASVLRFEQSVHQARLANALNREQHEKTIDKLCDYMEADGEQCDKLNQLETQVDQMLEQTMAVHREHYRLDSRFDTDDLMDRVQELAYQVSAIEEAFNMHLRKTLSPAEAVLQIAGVESKEAVDLIAQLRNFE